MLESGTEGRWPWVNPRLVAEECFAALSGVSLCRESLDGWRSVLVFGFAVLLVIWSILKNLKYFSVFY